MRVTVREPSLHTFRTRPIQCCRLKSSDKYISNRRSSSRERERDASFAVISGRVTSGREQTQLCTSFVFIDPIKHWLSLSKRIANTTRILACYFPVLSLIRNRDFSRLISPNFARFAINYISNFCMKGEEEEKKRKERKDWKVGGTIEERSIRYLLRSCWTSILFVTRVQWDSTWCVFIPEKRVSL